MADVPITPMDLRVGPVNNSPQLVADPTAPQFVVLANRLDGPDFSCALQVSDDRGRAWVTVNPVPKLPKGAQKCYAPEVAFDGDGILYYVFVGLRGKGNEPMGAFLATSRDRGQSFGPPRRLLGPLNFGVRMAIDRSQGARGRMHLVWLHASQQPGLGGFPGPPNPIMAAHSDDGGRTLSKPTQVSDPQRKYVVAPALTLGPDHAVHVAYYDLQKDAIDYFGVEGPVWPNTWSLVMSTSPDGGARFSQGVVVDARIRPSKRVMLIFTMPPASLAAGPKTVCAAWTDARRGDDDAMSRCSADAGRTWGALRRLNDDPPGNGASQYLPRLSQSPGGRIDAIFFDRRRDSDNAFNHIEYTYSTDGGASFAANLRLTTYPSDSRIGPQYAVPSAKGQFELGGRLGLLSFDDGVLAAWPDTHNISPLKLEQDLFATRVTSLPEPGSSTTKVLLLAAAAVAVLLGLAARWTRRTRRLRAQPV